MEFVGNQINVKTVLATLTVAFFIGRINLFNGTFPAAIALVTVMLAVSTVYIYLAPILAIAMATYIGQGVDFYGDLMAVVFLGLFFLFFHRQKFTINQRTALAVAAAILFNCIYYAYNQMLYLLSMETLIKEALALLIYIRVFNTIARTLFMGKSIGQISREKITIAIEIFVISFIGAIGISQVVFSLWLLAVAVTAYSKGIQTALTVAAMEAVFWLCQMETQWEIFVALFGGLIAGWYLAALIDGRYRKTILAIAIFIATGLSGNGQIYGAAVAMAIFVALPAHLITRLWCIAEERLMPEVATENDLRILAIRRDLLKKKEAFISLGKLYGAGMDNRQIISYQFTGMARTIDNLMIDLQGRGASSKGHEQISVFVGQASYAFEQVSGDSALAFEFDRSKIALMISDGMGKGSKAAAESKLVVTTLSRLLQAGFDVDLAMKTINSILMTGNNGETFATVDLAIVDKGTGRAKIFKMGAATTFVKHDGRVSMLKRQALPAGITQGLKLEYIDVRLKRGDLLVMVSDGVTDCDRKDPNCDWLRARLLEIGSRDPSTVAELIVNKAAEKYGIRERDDLTVMVAAIDV